MQIKRELKKKKVMQPHVSNSCVEDPVCCSLNMQNNVSLHVRGQNTCVFVSDIR